VTGDPGASRPAFYALRPGGWRDYLTILHVPYTAWHLSYVVIGGCLASSLTWSRLGLTVLAFFLAMGVGAHALDELQGRPLRTAIPDRVLLGLAVGSVAVASAIGVAVAVASSWTILPLVALGALLVPAYNLEWFGGRIHTDLGFALAWGAFPVVTAYVAQTGAVTIEVLLAAGWATAMSLAQRALSTPVRSVRRDATSVSGVVEHRDGRRVPVDRALLLGPSERALRVLCVSALLAAGAAVAVRL
jgi:hypothetical protein